MALEGSVRIAYDPGSMRFGHSTPALVALVLLVGARSAAAQSPFALHKTREVALLSTGGALLVTNFILLAGVDPLTVDEVNALDPNDVNDFDRDSIVPIEKSRSGDIMVAVSYLLPLSVFARDDTERDWHTIGVMWLEATALNLGLNGVVKTTALRTRPYAYDPDTPLDDKTTKSARLSFYSGHTASAACNCFFVARVFSEYVENRRAEIAMWTAAAAYPAVTGFLRVDTGHHFRTDIIVGYVAGALAGYLVPEFHRVADDRVGLRPATVGGNPGLVVDVAF